MGVAAARPTQKIAWLEGEPEFWSSTEQSALFFGFGLWLPKLALEVLFELAKHHLELPARPLAQAAGGDVLFERRLFLVCK
jgi:hypothetical protein